MGRSPSLAIFFVVVAACQAQAPTPTVLAGATASPPRLAAATATVAVTVPTTPPSIAPTPKATFPSGLYVVKPRLGPPGGGPIELLSGAGPLPVGVEVAGNGFDVSADFIVSSAPDGSGLVMARADGTTQRVPVKGLYGIGRPSLSPDGRQVIVQATEDASAAPGATPPPNTTYAVLHLDTVYVIELGSGSWRRIGDVPRNDPATGPIQAELPVWFPSGDRVAYWTIEAGCMVVKVRNAATAADLLTIKRNGTTGCYQPQRGILDGPRFHTAVSHDSSRMLIPGQMQVYDARTGALVADVHQKVMDGLAAAGYKPDARFPGQGGGGTFPLAGTFTPDDKAVVFDGAVEKDGGYGVLLARINVDGTGFTIVRGPVILEPKLSNNHNYSQLNPHWR